jgi:hypothetical protein
VRALGKPTWAFKTAATWRIRPVAVIGKREDDADQPPVLIVEEA